MKHNLHKKKVISITVQILQAQVENKKIIKTKSNNRKNMSSNSFNQERTNFHIAFFIIPII